MMAQAEAQSRAAAAAAAQQEERTEISPNPAFDSGAGGGAAGLGGSFGTAAFGGGGQSFGGGGFTANAGFGQAAAGSGEGAVAGGMFGQAGAEGFTPSAGFGGGNGGNGGGMHAQSEAPSANEDHHLGGAFDSLFGGGAASAPAAATAANDQEAATPAGDKEWYVAIDEAQVGPVDLHEIQERWENGEINEESLAWRAGMDDWAPVADIQQLAFLVASRPQKKAPAVAAAPATFATRPATGSAVTSSPVALSPVSFGGPGEEVSDVGWKPSAASALSSLVQEELVAEPKDKPATGPAIPEGLPNFGPGGDIFGGGGGALPAFSAPMADGFAAPSPGFAVPTPHSRDGGIKASHIFFAFIGVAVLAVLGVLGLIAYKLLNAPPPQMVVAPQPSAPVAALQPAPQPTAPTAAPAPAPAAAESEEEGDDTKGERGKKKGTKKDDKTAKGKTKGKREAADPNDELLKEPKNKPPEKDKLSVQDIVAGVKQNAGQVMPCLKAARDKGEIVPGTYKLILDWNISPSGSVADARLTGPGNVMGTTLPGCFAKAMKRWKFPSSKSGAPVKNFPFGPFTVK
jgi:hypothetical protein